MPTEAITTGLPHSGHYPPMPPVKPLNTSGDCKDICCRSCKFFARDQEDPGTCSKCQRHSPTPHPTGGMAQWPTVASNDQCGDWEPTGFCQTRFKVI